ncbi:MAG: glycosyltransferase family 2 protein [Desulfamplus sp.]|nr:glycosyltransferase family 2 protein [Desulfamplus sp.]
MLAYNNVSYLKAAIDSIKEQTYQNWELLISDDCSSDGTWELASTLSNHDERIKVYKTYQNIGVVKNRKIAYSYATGDFVCHVDADDMVERWALEEMLIAFDKSPDVMLIYSDMAQIGQRGEHQLYSASKNFDKNRLYQHGWRHLGMYRKSVMDSIEGYNEKLVSACEDGDLFMQIAEKYPCQRLAKPLYFYRSHGNNSSSKNKHCSNCSERAVCNFIHVWAKSANYDPITFTPLKK